MTVLFFTFSGHDLGLAHAHDPDLVDTATDLAHAAVATAGTYTTVLTSQKNRHEWSAYPRLILLFVQKPAQISLLFQTQKQVGKVF